MCTCCLFAVYAIKCMVVYNIQLVRLAYQCYYHNTLAISTSPWALCQVTQQGLVKYENVYTFYCCVTVVSPMAHAEMWVLTTL